MVEIGRGRTIPKPRVSYAPKKLAAAVVFLAVAGAMFFSKGQPGRQQAHAPSSSKFAERGESDGPAAAPNLIDQTGGSLPKRSGANTMEAAVSYYKDVADASEILFSTQARKGLLGLLPGALAVDQVTGKFIIATHKSTREQWIIRPDNPSLLNEVSIPEGSAIIMVVGMYMGPERVTTVAGAERRLPCIRAFCLDTTRGFVNCEDPQASVGGEEYFKAKWERDQAEIQQRIDRRGGQENHETPRAGIGKAETPEEKEALNRARQELAKRHGELEQGTAGEQESRKGLASPSGSRETGATVEQAGKEEIGIELAKARADLAAVKSKIESERKRYSDALQVINTLTNNKTVPVKEGSAAYHRCMEASRIIGEVEKGAPDLKAEKARLETLVGELDPEIQE